ncbi:dual specificity protein phosphatase 19-like [Haliotis rufescens]|uniref:dual specificity protein phosphatase 19-like n=1 Tax=Haliotis rufescens TaxID=6454 RepID=UPI001EAFF21A|nr:dual specificity protein phosphatase 19-like [Haliotis rufescens]
MDETDNAKQAESKTITGLVKEFDRSALKKTQTKVITVEGVQIIEERDARGKFVVHEVRQPNGILGYVADVRQDLQVGEVMPGLIVGSQDVAHNLDLLKQYKVSHILNCATLVENLYPYKYKYKNIELYDIPETPIMRHFNEALDFIDEGRTASCVLVHCNAGVSRSATFVIAYLMKKEGITFKEAFNFLRSKRPATCPNPGFVSQLKKYEEILKQKNDCKKSGKSRTHTP